MINAFQWYFHPSTLRPNTEHVHDVIFTWHFVQRLVHGVMSSRATLHSEYVRISISTLARSSYCYLILHSLPRPATVATATVYCYCVTPQISETAHRTLGLACGFGTVGLQ